MRLLNFFLFFFWIVKEGSKSKWKKCPAMNLVYPFMAVSFSPPCFIYMSCIALWWTYWHVAFNNTSSSSSWALLSFHYMCGHIVGRDVVPHRTTVLHKYNIQHEVKQYKPTLFCICFKCAPSFTAIAKVQLFMCQKEVNSTLGKCQTKCISFFLSLYHQCISGISNQMRTKNQSTRQRSKRRPSTLNSMK